MASHRNRPQKPFTVCGWPRVRIPESCRGKEIVIGIDEAGRGPVLGSLVYCAAFWPADQNEEISKLGFDDSKQVKESERDRLFEGIKNHPSIGWVIEELTAEEISEEMLRVDPVSLNAISYNAVIRALEIIRDGGRGHIAVETVESTTTTASSSGSGSSSGSSSVFSTLAAMNMDPPIITDIFIDTVGDPEYYKSRLTNALGNDFANFTIEKKADATYKVVSAASIIAKVTRDTTLSQWEWSETSLRAIMNKEFGSGYPGDEKCVQWLSQAQNVVFGFPNLIRFSWSTSREALKNGVACPVHWACEDEDTGGSEPITAFFQAVGEKRTKRTAYFTQRKMKHMLPSDIM